MKKSAFFDGFFHAYETQQHMILAPRWVANRPIVLPSWHKSLLLQLLIGTKPSKTVRLPTLVTLFPNCAGNLWINSLRLKVPKLAQKPDRKIFRPPLLAPLSINSGQYYSAICLLFFTPDRVPPCNDRGEGLFQNSGSGSNLDDPSCSKNR